jgi:L,D-peptidoglycan transpeptidase YkuD (ErfK/YbiS/YcfS/YnhG family)
MIKRAAAFAAFAALMLTIPGAGAARAQSCPAVLGKATHLALVTVSGMRTSFGKLMLYSRDRRDASWKPVGTAHQVRLGQNGLAWGPGFTRYAQHGEPLKRESDWRSPAGVYRIGAPFGFGASHRPGYVRIKSGETYCVDDVRSPAYNTITTIAKAGRFSGERMSEFPEYRHGLFIDYPSTHARPADSCIFIHLLSADSTAGCIAMAEDALNALQDFAAAGAVIAIVPRPAFDRFKGCLP